MIAAAEHFVAPPHWEWYIVGYFFLAGIAGGSYVLGTIMRLWGSPSDEGAARIAFYISFPALILCPLLLTLDLGRPSLFWHMLIDSSPGGALVFKYWTPMSLGAWGLTIFGVFSAGSFVEALAADRRIRIAALDRALGVLRGSTGRAFIIVGSILGLFVAAYTGVLLSVSNQPIWSDTATLGALFLVSGLSGAAAVLLLVARWRRGARGTVERISRADAYFVVMEVGLIAALMATVGIAGSFRQLVSGRWALLWIVVGVSLAAALAAQLRLPVIRRVSTYLIPVLTLAGVWVLRTVIVFSAQS